MLTATTSLTMAAEWDLAARWSMDTIGLAITTGAGAVAVELMVAYLFNRRRPDLPPSWAREGRWVTTNDGATWVVSD